MQTVTPMTMSRSFVSPTGTAACAYLLEALQHSQQTCPDQKGKPNPRPTARRVFQSFIDISVLHVSSLKSFVVGLTTAPKALLTLLGDRYVTFANSG